MAIPTRTVQGKILAPDGSGQAGGTLEIKLSFEGQVTDDSSGDEHSIGGEVVAVIASGDGSVNFDLVPNDQIQPSGSRYRVRFRMPDGYWWDEYWNLPSGSAIDIGAIVRDPAPRPDVLPSWTFVADFPTPSSVWHGKTLIKRDPPRPDIKGTCLGDGQTPESFSWVGEGVG